jgi:pSer/pThr/pTyr-binding forkhead associated (FHA) protein
MLEVSLTYPTPDGSREIPIDGEKLSFGRGSDADQRFADDGLSRLHATLYREGDRIWVVDENSSNGTFVNGERVTGAGTPLRNGDSIRIGHQTTLKVRIAQSAAQVSSRGSQVSVATSAPSKRMGMAVPLAVIAATFLIVSVSAVFIGIKVFGSKRTEIVQREKEDGFEDIDEKPSKEKDTKATVTPKTTSSDTKQSTSDETIITDTPSADTTKPAVVMPQGKKYLDLSDAERRQYLSDRAMRIAQIIGNRSSEAIPAEALDKIKGFVDAYAKRANVKPLGGCRFGDNLQATYERASKNAPFIVRAFNEKGTDPRIGLYLAMIESEHCVCLQSPTGPLGMFQFTYATAKLHFEPPDGVVKGASVANPDDRCKPEPAARAAASYMKALTGRYGTGPASVPLAIGSYNSGEGGLSSNLQKALDLNTGLPRDFWTLIAKGDILSKQFQSENFKYVPKFFAAAIIGENPQDFGLNLQPISTYTK